MLHLTIAKEVGDRAGEGRAYCNLGNAYDSLGDFKQAIDYYMLHLTIAKEVGDRAGEGGAYCNLGIAYRSLGDFKQAIDYHMLHLTIAKKKWGTGLEKDVPAAMLPFLIYTSLISGKLRNIV